MKTLLLADRNLFSYSFISALPLSLGKYLYKRFRCAKRLDAAERRAAVGGLVALTGNSCPG